jgi:hypothetical protein
MEFDTRVAGIPCIARVVHHLVVKGHRGACNPDDYYGYEEFEVEILDRRGRPAPWLQRKITSADDDRIYSDFLAASEAERDYI